MPDTCLIGDIGGTNARFALVDPDQSGYRDEQSLRCSDYPTVDDATRTYLDLVGSPRLSAVCLAAAGPVVDGSIKLTNHPWTLRHSSLSITCGTPSIRLINDFEAMAYSLLALGPGDSETIGHLPPPNLASNLCMAVIGPGTGLGAAGLIRRGDSTLALVTEAGHQGFAPETPEQTSVRDAMLKHLDRVSDEAVVSGAGLENIYRALGCITGADNNSATAAEIFALARNGDDLADEAVQLLFEAFGQIAGNFALAIGAFDGVFLTGGLVQRHPDLLRSSRFRSGFEAKGPHRGLLERTPTAIVTHPQPGLLGASVVVRGLAE